MMKLTRSNTLIDEQDLSRIVNEEEIESNGHFKINIECSCCQAKLILPKKKPLACTTCFRVYDADCLKNLKNGYKCQYCQKIKFKPAKDEKNTVKAWKVCKVQCRNVSKGCTEVLSLDELEEHELHHCKFKKCDDCQQSFTGTFREHQIGECSAFKMQCLYCNKLLTRGELMTSHDCDQRYLSNNLLSIKDNATRFDYTGSASNEKEIRKSISCIECEQFPIRPVECQKCAGLLCKKCRLKKGETCKTCDTKTQFGKVKPGNVSLLDQVTVQDAKCTPPKWIRLESWISNYFENHFYCNFCHKKIQPGTANNNTLQINAVRQGMHNLLERFDEQQAINFIESAKVKALFELHQIQHPIDKKDLLAIYKSRLQEHQEELLAIYLEQMDKNQQTIIKLSALQTINKHLYLDCERIKHNCDYCAISFPQKMYAKHQCRDYFRYRIIETALIGLTFFLQPFLFGFRKGLYPGQCDYSWSLHKSIGEGLMTMLVYMFIGIICLCNIESFANQKEEFSIKKLKQSLKLSDMNPLKEGIQAKIVSYLSMIALGALLTFVNLFAVKKSQELCQDKSVINDYLNKGYFYSTFLLKLATLIYWATIGSACFLSSIKIKQYITQLKKCDEKGFLTN